MAVNGLKRIAVMAAFALTLLLALPVGPACASGHSAVRPAASRFKTPFPCCRRALTRVLAADVIPFRFHDRIPLRRLDGAMLSHQPVRRSLAARPCVASGVRYRVFLVTQRLRL